jgi:iron complex outermembrane receptor protein
MMTMFTQKNSPIQTVLLVLIFSLVFAFNKQLLAKQQETNEQMAGDELLLFEDIPMVVSASRKTQPLTELSVPVSVITAEDIHYSGLTTIPEILRFTPGVDVIQLSRGRFAVGVRGLHDFISDRTLTLINSRIADSPFFGGSEFYRLPILLEDIERIEVVRGPGGAAWGANAFTGVINIITKKPDDVQGWFGSSTISEFGDSLTHLRWADKADKWSWRVSVGYGDVEDSDKAGAGRFESGNPILNPLIGFSGFSTRDFSRILMFDSEAIYAHSDRTKISFGIGYSHNQSGDYEFGGFYPMENTWYETARTFVKINRIFENGSSGYLQWFGNFMNSQSPSLVKWRSSENDIEGQLNFEPSENHKMLMGGNFRLIRVGTESDTLEDLMYRGEPYDEQLAGAFVIDRWQMTDRVALEGQIRGDWYSETQIDWSSRFSVLYAIDEQKHHMLRCSFAKAYRAPLSSLRKTATSRISLAPLGFPGLTAFNVLPPDDLDNEETWSLEAGYTGKITDRLTLRADGYYQRFSRLIGYRRLPDPLPLPFDRAFYQPDNIDGADSYGVEVEIEKRTKAGKLSAWYAYNDFRTDQVNQSVRSYAPANHKAGLTARLFLDDAWTFNANYAYSNTTEPLVTDTLFPVETSHCLDLTVATRFADGRGEFMLGVSDVLNKTDGPNFSMGQITAHETPGRTFFARVQLRF